MNHLVSRLLVVAALASLLSACAGPRTAADSTISDRLPKLEALPKWARDGLYDERSLDIDRVMATAKLSRLEAVEAQNRYRDQLDSASGASAETAYANALAEVRAGKLESGFKPVEFKKPGEFVVALDLDETLLQQWHVTGATGNFDFNGVMPDSGGPGRRSGDWIKLTPGTEAFILALKANPLCRGVVLFSAKEDAPALDIVAKWRFSDGSPARAHLDGVFTRNHLVIGPKVTTPSKDLRVLDPELKHVLIVDDNPARVVQLAALRAQPKFDADAWKLTKDAAVRKHYDHLLDVALAEIRESAAAAEQLKIPFTQAYLPYSYGGTRVYQSLLASLKDRRQALKVTRMNPGMQDAPFVAPKR